jgi:hypothetical protein
MDLNKPFGNLKLPLNLEHFRNNILQYLLKKESGPHYLQALTQNMEACAIPLKMMNSDLIQGVDPSGKALKELRQEIAGLYSGLESKLTLLDGLSEHRRGIESELLKGPEDPKEQKRGFDYRIRFYEKLIERLYLKKNHIQTLLQYKDEKIRDPSDNKNVTEILQYYENRVAEDLKIVEDDKMEIMGKAIAFEKEIYLPRETKMAGHVKVLEDIMVNYKKGQDESLQMKNELDDKLVKFITMWYRWIEKLNLVAMEAKL